MQMTRAISLVTKRGLQELDVNTPIRFLINDYIVDGIIDNVDVNFDRGERADFQFGMVTPMVRRVNDRIKIEISLFDGNISKPQKKEQVFRI